MNACMQCCAAVEHVLLTDIRDARFSNKDPFALMRAGNFQYQLFMNTDRNNEWMRTRFSEANLTVPSQQVRCRASACSG